MEKGAREFESREVGSGRPENAGWKPVFQGSGRRVSLAR